MSARVITCPHCGATDASRDPRDHEVAAAKAQRGPRERLSGAEALTLMDSAPQQRQFWRDFFLPSSSLSGWWVALDWLLIVMTLPLVAGLVVSLAQGVSNDGKARITGLYVENILVAVLGGGVVLAIGYGTGAFYTLLPWVGGAVGALAGRVLLRVMHR